MKTSGTTPDEAIAGEEATLLALLAELEAYLLHHDHRVDPARLETLLAAELSEITAQGQRVERAEVKEWLLAKPQEARWVFEELTLTRLGDTYGLLQYVARQVAGGGSGRPGRHGSLWQRTERGQWQLLFHQATRIQDRD